MNEILEMAAPEQTSRKVFMCGIVPREHAYYSRAAWQLVKPLAEEIISGVMQEYTIQALWQSIFLTGMSRLYLAYELPWGKAEDPNDGEMLSAVLEQLMKDPKQDFVGYTVMNLNGNDSFLWHVYIMPKYQKTNAVRLGFDYLKKEAMEIGSTHMACSVYNPTMETICENRGFKRTYSVFRMELPKKEQS